MNIKTILLLLGFALCSMMTGCVHHRAHHWNACCQPVCPCACAVPGPPPVPFHP